MLFVLGFDFRVLFDAVKSFAGIIVVAAVLPILLISVISLVDIFFMI
jgi:hypothetical protein